MRTGTNDKHSSIEPAATWNPLRWPLYLRVLLGVVIGTVLGIKFGSEDIAFGWSNEDLKDLGGLYIRLLTALATPLIFFAIVDAFVQTRISGWQGLKLIFVCCVNIAVAFAIGLTILNVWQPGRTWQGTLVERATDSQAANAGQIQRLSAAAEESSLSLLKLLDSYVPKSIAQPASDNMVLTVAVLAIFLGAAMRSLKSTSDTSLARRDRHVRKTDHGIISDSPENALVADRDRAVCNLPRDSWRGGSDGRRKWLTAARGRVFCYGDGRTGPARSRLLSACPPGSLVACRRERFFEKVPGRFSPAFRSIAAWPPRR